VRPWYTEVKVFAASVEGLSICRKGSLVCRMQEQTHNPMTAEMEADAANKGLLAAA
jgi:hypothetical protein